MTIESLAVERTPTGNRIRLDVEIFERPLDYLAEDVLATLEVEHFLVIAGVLGALQEDGLPVGTKPTR